MAYTAVAIHAFVVFFVIERYVAVRGFKNDRVRRGADAPGRCFGRGRGCSSNGSFFRRRGFRLDLRCANEPNGGANKEDCGGYIEKGSHQGFVPSLSRTCD